MGYFLFSELKFNFHPHKFKTIYISSFHPILLSFREKFEHKLFFKDKNKI